MIDPKQLEKLVRQIQETLPKGIRNLGSDIEKKIHQVLQNQFSRMNLISRNEFDVQTQVLLRTRDKLNQLELRLNTLETIYKNKITISTELDDKNTPITENKNNDTSKINNTTNTSSSNS